MKLARVSVDKYRSIDRAATFEVFDYTSLVGANNQGKSNLLRALKLGMEILDRWPAPRPDGTGRNEVPLEYFGYGPRRRLSGGSGRNGDDPYDWQEDFPIFARKRSSGPKSTRIRLRFILTEQEMSDFKEITGSTINERLPIEISIGDKACSLSVTKQGRGTLKEKAPEVAKFISRRLTLLYIPAVRGSDTSIDVASAILSSRRRLSVRSAEYEEHFRALEAIEEDVKNEVGDLLQRALEKFVPDVSSVAINTRPVRQMLRVEDIVIDDGDATSFLRKGDGIQSLIALALAMEWTQSKSGPDVDLIVAVEEPEAHLHPRAIHELRNVLDQISQTQQIIVTTHSQVFIDRYKIAHNVLVAERTAHSARSLDDLREALGLTASDGLVADVSLIVEGSSDVAVVTRLLKKMSSDCKSAIEGGRLSVLAAGRCSLVSTHVRAAEMSLSVPIVLLDGDSAGAAERSKLLDNDLIDPDRVVVVTRAGSRCSELEDIVDPLVYMDRLEEVLEFKFSENQRGRLLKNKRTAWSERLDEILSDCGVADSSERVKEGKRVVTSCACRALDSGRDVVREESRESIAHLVRVVERCLP